MLRALCDLQVQDPTLPSSSEVAALLEETRELLKAFRAAELYMCTLASDHELQQKAWHCCTAAPTKVTQPMGRIAYLHRGLAISPPC